MSAQPKWLQRIHAYRAEYERLVRDEGLTQERGAWLVDEAIAADALRARLGREPTDAEIREEHKRM